MQLSSDISVVGLSTRLVCAGGEVKRKVGIVGKGLTFDSGGYNLKAGAGWACSACWLN